MTQKKSPEIVQSLMPLKSENKSNAVYNDFKNVWNQQKSSNKQPLKEAKPLLDGVPSKDKAGFQNRSIPTFIEISHFHWLEIVSIGIILKTKLRNRC